LVAKELDILSDEQVTILTLSALKSSVNKILETALPSPPAPLPPRGRGAGGEGQK